MDKVFDPTRKKYVIATPEELVRQNFIKFLLDNGYPLQMIKTEVSLDFAGQKRRADIVVYHNGKPAMIVECKAPNVNIDSDTFTQVWQYFYAIGAEYLVLTNGVLTFVCHIEGNKCVFTSVFPTWQELKRNIAK